MPIKPVNPAKYEPIPDSEDVTPLTRELPTAVYPGKSRKVLYLSIAALLLLIPVGILYEQYHRVYRRRGVAVYQTSKRSFDEHVQISRIVHRLQPIDLQRHWPETHYVSFGNMPQSSQKKRDAPTEKVGRVRVDTRRRFQRILGFGGSFTESSAYNFYKLPQSVRETLLALYYAPLSKSADVVVNKDKSSSSLLSAEKKYTASSSAHLKKRTLSENEENKENKETTTEIMDNTKKENDPSSPSLTEWLSRRLGDSLSLSLFPSDTLESGLTLGRVHINSCDFSLSSHSFDDVPEDVNLDFFDHEVTHDTVQIIPFISEAMTIIERYTGRELKLVASPWSPPAWMKVPVTNSDGNTTSSMLGSALPNGLRDEPLIKTAWARFISYFVGAYRWKGVPIWAVTPQNEPEFPAPWEACSYTAEFQRDFIAEYLGPIMKHDHPDVKLLAFDHNKDHIAKWTQTMFAKNSKAKDFIDGMAFHWYGGEDRLTDGTYGYDNLHISHALIPDKLLLGTEACSCPGIEKDSWFRAERVAHDILYDLQAHANGWIDWNLLLNAQGGPNHLNNNCDAPFFTLEDYSDIHVQPKFFIFSHFFRFIVPDSVRVQSQAVGHYAHAIMDVNIQPNIELGVFSCEASVRQMWRVEKETQRLQLYATLESSWPAESERDYALPYSATVPLCVATGDGNRQFLRLTPCSDVSKPKKNKNNNNNEQDDENKNDILRELRVNHAANGQLVDIASGNCISFGSPFFTVTGTLLVLEDCNTEKAPRFQLDQHFELRVLSDLSSPQTEENGLCVTAGWPFLNAVAAQTPQNRTVVVITNEAPVATKFVVYDENRDEEMALFIDASATQTVVYM